MCLGRGRKVKREGSKPGQMESELTKYLQTRDKARVQTSVKPVKKKKVCLRVSSTLYGCCFSELLEPNES